MRSGSSTGHSLGEGTGAGHSNGSIKLLGVVDAGFIRALDKHYWQEDIHDSAF
jgi:hypothetical protein